MMDKKGEEKSEERKAEIGIKVILQHHFPLRYNDILINILTQRDGSRNAYVLWTTNVCPINTIPDATLATTNVPIFNLAK
jgi:hypothetical protein